MMQSEREAADFRRFPVRIFAFLIPVEKALSTDEVFPVRIKISKSKGEAFMMNLRDFIKKSGKILLVCTLTASFLLPAGCGKSSSGSFGGSSSSGESESSSSTEAVQPPQEESDGLELLRDLMEEHSRGFAVAYFDRTWEDDVFEYMKERAPELCDMLPFLLEIPKERVVDCVTAGIGLYCIVPADPNASVTVKRIDEDWMPPAEPGYETVAYESESGEPILLTCGDWGASDAQVTITDSEGNLFIWYPKRDSTDCVESLTDGDWNELLLDFSPYEEALAYEHAELQATGLFGLPAKEDLVGTVWKSEELLRDGRDYICQIAFHEDTVDVRWNDGIDEEDHEYKDAPWELKQENGYAVLTIDFGEFAGKLSHNLLVDAQMDVLFTMQDVSTGEIKELGWEKQSRSLYRQSVNVPEPEELVGTWERYEGEFEGMVNPSEPGTCTIVIQGSDRDNLTISYTDKESPNKNYKNKALKVSEKEMYSGCGNSVWLADVDHVGPYDTTYAITGLEDGALLLQNYWLMDGAPSVSYEWFRRVD